MVGRKRFEEAGPGGLKAPRKTVMRREGYIIEEIADYSNMSESFNQVLRGTSRKRSRQGRYLLAHREEVIKELTVSVGTVNQTVASPRELFLEALRCEAVSVLMIHNHPSGDPTPSRQDILTTKRMKEAGEFLGIPLCDHIIIGDQTYLSFREEHMM